MGYKMALTLTTRAMAKPFNLFVPMFIAQEYPDTGAGQQKIK